MKETAHGKSEKTTVIYLVFKFYFAHNDERLQIKEINYLQVVGWESTTNHMAFVLDA